MFTGIIEDIGIIRRIETRGNYRVLTVGSKVAGEKLTLGESISCDGVCLTVVSFDRESFVVEASQESSARTIIDRYQVGSKINLERAMRADGRLGGHLVSGHTDCRGTVDYLKPVGQSLELAAKFDEKYDALVIEKGSIALQGVSLTINEVRPGWCSVNMIPFTAKHTTLGSLGSGDQVNVEFDMIGKYIAKLGAGYQRGNVTMEKLKESGW
jgi:riboflavin synthase